MRRERARPQLSFTWTRWLHHHGCRARGPSKTGRTSAVRCHTRSRPRFRSSAVIGVSVSLIMAPLRLKATFGPPILSFELLRFVSRISRDTEQRATLYRPTEPPNPESYADRARFSSQSLRSGRLRQPGEIAPAVLRQTLCQPRRRLPSHRPYRAGAHRLQPVEDCPLHTLLPRRDLRSTRRLSRRAGGYCRPSGRRRGRGGRRCNNRQATPSAKCARYFNRFIV